MTPSRDIRLRPSIGAPEALFSGMEVFYALTASRCAGTSEMTSAGVLRSLSASVAQQQCAIGELLDDAEIVGDEHDRLALLPGSARTSQSTSPGSSRRRPRAPRRAAGCRSRPGSRSSRRAAPACPTRSSSASGRRSARARRSRRCRRSARSSSRAREAEQRAVDADVVARVSARG